MVALGTPGKGSSWKDGSIWLQKGIDMKGWSSAIYDHAYFIHMWLTILPLSLVIAPAVKGYNLRTT